MFARHAPPTTDDECISVIVDDRRVNSRTRTIYRIARVRAAADQGLALVRNISDGGMRLTIGFAVAPGDTVEVWLSETLVFDGRIVWVEGGECGIEFTEWIDSSAALRLAAEETRLGKARPPRLALSITAVVVSERGSHFTDLHDISQRGVKIRHDGSFTPGLPVKVIVGPGTERRGIVRWVRSDLAGVILTEPFSIQELGSVNAL